MKRHIIELIDLFDDLVMVSSWKLHTLIRKVRSKIKE